MTPDEQRRLDYRLREIELRLSALEGEGSGPVTFDELAKRGLDERLETVLQGVIGEALRPLAPDLCLTVPEMAALGYGAPCSCGERGILPGEKTCPTCGSCKECCDGNCDCQDCSCKGQGSTQNAPPAG